MYCCSVLKEEVESLKAASWPGWSVRYFSSMLHMRPVELAKKLTTALDAENQQVPLVIIYGDCCMMMEQFERKPGIARTRGVNCCELILGRELYKSLISDGAFFLLPEWIVRWEEIFTRELGLSAENATDLMHDMHTRLVYLDTGVIPVPLEEIIRCSSYCGLPFEILTVSCDHLKHLIDDAITRAESGGA